MDLTTSAADVFAEAREPHYRVACDGEPMGIFSARQTWYYASHADHCWQVTPLTAAIAAEGV